MIGFGFDMDNQNRIGLSSIQDAGHKNLYWLDHDGRNNSLNDDFVNIVKTPLGKNLTITRSINKSIGDAWTNDFITKLVRKK